MAVPSGLTFDPLTTCFSVSNLPWQDLPLWEILQEVDSQVFADYLLATQKMSAWGSQGPEPFMNSEELQQKSPILQRPRATPSQLSCLTLGCCDPTTS